MNTLPGSILWTKDSFEADFARIEARVDRMKNSSRPQQNGGKKLGETGKPAAPFPFSLQPDSSIPCSSTLPSIILSGSEFGTGSGWVRHCWPQFRPREPTSRLFRPKWNNSERQRSLASSVSFSTSFEDGSRLPEHRVKFVILRGMFLKPDRVKLGFYDNFWSLCLKSLESIKICTV